MQEEAQAVYAWDYSEADGRDPAPNTSFPTWRDITAPTGLRISSGTDYVKRRGDGTRQPFARVTWDQSTEPSVLSGGWLELEWLINDAQEWQRSGRIDAYTTAYHIVDAAANDLFRVRLRAVNLVAASPWVYSTATINSASGPGTSALGVGNGVNAVPDAKLRTNLGGLGLVYIPTGQVLFLSESGSTAAGSPGALYLTYQGVVASGYGAAGVAEIGAGSPSGTRAFLFASELIPVSPGDVWELQAWAALFGFSASPSLLYYNAAGVNIAASWDSLPLVSSENVESFASLSGEGNRIFRQLYRYVVIPPGVASARWALPLTRGGAAGDPAAFVTMPFAARCSIASEASLRANPLTYLTSWNG